MTSLITLTPAPAVAVGVQAALVTAREELALAEEAKAAAEEATAAAVADATSMRQAEVRPHP